MKLYPADFVRIFYVHKRPPFTLFLADKVRRILDRSPRLRPAALLEGSDQQGDTKIHLDVFGDPLDFEILEIAETRLVLSLLFPDDPTVQLPYEKIVFPR